MRARDVLGPDGPLARALPGYEAREAQLAMADAVERVLDEDRKLVVEAGTGTGKTLAYLVPAILSGRKIVISTATKALQEQIVAKDLPLLAEHARLSADVALVKGLGNYLCLRRYSELKKSPEALRPSVGATIDTIERWIHETDSGDLAELVTLPEGDPVRADVASSSETRLGQGCAFFEGCFVTRMKREAERARILVVNHHLFFADLALRGPHGEGALPPYDAVIFDEAHQIEDVASDFYGVRVSTSRLEALARDAERAFVAAGLATTLLRKGGEGGKLVHDVRDAGAAFFSGLGRSPGAETGRVPLDASAWNDRQTAAWHRLDAALEAMECFAEAHPSSQAIESVAIRSRSLRDDLAEIASGPGRRVTWVESGPRSVSIGATPVDMAETLRRDLFDAIPACVLTSATLATGGGFRFLRSRVGLDDPATEVDELLLASPFDFPNRSLLYLARDLPEPSDPRFLDAAATRAADLVRASGGGAFVLCTSNRAMRAIHASLRARGTPRLLVQGEAPKTSLLARFRAEGNAVLVATMSFWEGVDVPGEALRLVVIDKCPFPVPADPLVVARSMALEEAGQNAFTQYHVPTAAIALKQGFGRLLRTKSDRGVVAILDARVASRSYGRALLAALPPARRTERLEDVEAFFRG